MRGLILNNFYLIKDNLRIGIILVSILLLTYICYPSQVILFTFVFIALFLPSCFCLNAVMISKSSRWNYYEKSMPFKDNKVILSRYLNFIIISVIAIVLILLVGGIRNVLSDVQFLEQTIRLPGMRVFTVFEMIKTYFFQSHFLNILYFPLIYLLKTDKMDTVILVSVGVSLVVVFLIRLFSLLYLSIITVGLYGISYILSCMLVRREKSNL